MMQLNDTPVFVFTAIESSTGRIKIGISKNPEARIKQLQQGNPDSIVLVSSYRSNNAYHEKQEILEDNYLNVINGDWLSYRAIDSVPVTAVFDVQAAVIGVPL